MLKSEIYKLFSRKSFYVCAIVIMIMTGIRVWSYASYLSTRCGFDVTLLDLKETGLTGWEALKGLSFDNLTIVISSIFTSIFVCSEFSSGVIKNLVLRGKNKFSIYFSKMIVSMLVPFVYTVLSAAVSFFLGSYLWNWANWEQKYLNSIIIPILLFLLVQMAYQSIFVMFCYLFKSSGWSTAVNFGFATSLIPMLVIGWGNYVLKNWFGVTESFLYWMDEGFANVYSYSFPLEDELMKIFPWVVLGYFVIPAIIGSIIFWKREVK